MSYTMLPFSRVGSRKTGLDRCAICGRRVVQDMATKFAVIVNGGTAWGNRDSDPNDPGFMGEWPIGADCHRKYKVTR